MATNGGGPMTDTTRPTAAGVRAEPAGRRLDLWVLTVVYGYRFVPAGEWRPIPAEQRDRSHWAPPEGKYWPHYDAGIDESGYHVGHPVPRYSTDPAACAELKRHLWAGGRYNECRVEVSRSWVSVQLYPAEGDYFIKEEPTGTDPVAAECLAWCRVALLAELGRADR